MSWHIISCPILPIVMSVITQMIGKGYYQFSVVIEQATQVYQRLTQIGQMFQNMP